MQDKKNYLLTEAKTTFEKFQVNNNLLKKLKKFKYSNDKKLLKLIFSAGNLKEINKKDKQSIPIRLDFVEKRNIDRSTFYSIDGPFQLIQADIVDFLVEILLRFLGESATHPKYCLLAADVFSSEVCTYQMRQRDLLTKKTKNVL